MEYEGTNELGQMADSIRSMVRTLSDYVADISKILEHLSQKQLNTEIGMEYIGDFKGIQCAMNTIIHFMNETIALTRVASQSISGGASLVSDISGKLAENATEQASAVQQAALTINNVFEHMMENAKNAEYVNKISHKANEKMQMGNLHMKHLVETMGEIFTHSEQISGIISIIDSIAAQTNLLSLNASIEAAHAGDAGKDTTQLIQASIEVTGKGSKFADETVAIITEVSGTVNETGMLVENITKACGEGASALEEITTGINIISKHTDSLSAMSKEASATSEEFLSQTYEMDEMLLKFKLCGDR